MAYGTAQTLQLECLGFANAAVQVLLAMLTGITPVPWDATCE
jgi:hypothetical protein